MTTSHFCSHCGADNTPNNAFCSACQQPLDAIQETTILLNERYAILAEVGAGGFGAVYQARDTQEQDRLVAVKQINLKGLSPQEIIEATDAFNREAQLLSTLRHPLLPRIFDRFSDAEHWYLVMTFIDGSTLDEYVQQQAAHALPARAGLSLNETLRIGLQLCEVLAYLHTQQPPVIFRDIKPGNIMRTSSGRLYLIDFGIARHFKPGQARDTIPFGSPGFAAPEQYGRAQTTPQADIYSLGALLSCLISGDDPADHPFQFSPLRLYDIDGISELDTLIQRMVALAPEQRPATIEAVRDELLAIQQIHAQAHKHHIWTPTQGLTPDASAMSQQHIFLAPSSSTLPARKTTRRRVVTAGLAVGGAVLVGGIVTALASQQRSFSSSAAYTSSQGGNSTVTATGQTAAVPLNGPTYWSPDLSYAAVINRKQSQLELYKVQSQRSILNISIPAIFSYPTAQWSLDKSKILLQDSAGTIEAWNLQNGLALFTFTSTMWRYSTGFAVLSPDGQYCAISTPQKTNIYNSDFTLLQTANGEQLFSISFTDYGFDSIECMAWSTDSKYIAFALMTYSSDTTGGQSWSAYIWDRETHQVVNTFDGILSTDAFTMILSVAWSPSNKKLAFVSEKILWLSYLDKKPHLYIPIDMDYKELTYGPLWSPNEKYLAILLDQNLAIWDIASKRTIQLKGNSSPSNIAAIAWSADSQSIAAADSNNVISHWTIG